MWKVEKRVSNNSELIILKIKPGQKSRDVDTLTSDDSI